MSRLIDADALCDKLESIGWWDNRDRDTAETSVMYSPTISPENLRPHGKWIVLVHDEESGCDIFGCSECRKVTGIVKPRWKWCPECGAKMEGEIYG